MSKLKLKKDNDYIKRKENFRKENLQKNIDVEKVENTNVLGVFEDISSFISSDICDLELCELSIFQNFKLVEISMSQFLNEVFLED